MSFSLEALVSIHSGQEEKPAMEERKAGNLRHENALATKARKEKDAVGDSPDLLNIVSQRAHLSEGEEAVRRILRETYRRRKTRTRDLAYLTELPVPVAAAVRRELEKEGLLSRKGGAVLTERGRNYVERILGLSMVGTLSCPSCSGKKIPVSDQFSPILNKLEQYSRLRPEPRTWLDQAFGTPETALLRALFMLEEGDVEGRNVLFLGDDDLTSVAVGLLSVARRITVIDVDERLLELIGDISERERLAIECVHHDLRNPLPDDLRDRYDVVFTDPPYTTQGLRLFLSRGIEALRKRKCAGVYLAFAHKRPEEMLELQKAISGMGLVIRELIPRFNTYEGAEMFANTTFLARLETTDETRPSITKRFEGKLYSGQVSPTIRTYRCNCGKEIEVGFAKSFRTIEQLKSEGCPACGGRKGFRLLKKIRLNEKKVDAKS